MYALVGMIFKGRTSDHTDTPLHVSSAWMASINHEMAECVWRAGKWGLGIHCYYERLHVLLRFPLGPPPLPITAVVLLE